MITIQFNTDKSIEAEERHQEYFSNQISDALSRFENHITRVEVHLKDKNGSKAGHEDKTCVLEARLKCKQPIAVTSHADSISKAVSFATDKAVTAINTIVGKGKSR